MPTQDLPQIIPYGTQVIDASDIASVVSVLQGSHLTQGPAIAGFEDALSEWLDGAEVVAVSNGTAALHLACAVLGLGAGDVGVTTPISFAASANGFLYCGADAVFTDVDPLTGLMCPKALDRTLAELNRKGQRPGVVVAVSLAGRVADMRAMRSICNAYGWRLVEDAAQSLMAHGADGVKSASCAHSDMATLSFHPVKHITTGEGGAVVTRDATLAARLRLLRSHGIEKPWAHDSGDDLHEPAWFYRQIALGWNYRMCDMQAALGESQMLKAELFLRDRRAVAERYDRWLQQDPFEGVLRSVPGDAGHAYHLYVVHWADESTRNRAFAFLRKRGVITQVHHVPIYRHPYYEQRYGPQRFAGAEAYYAGCMSLPMYPGLSERDQAYVVESLAEFVRLQIGN
ncbi:MAG: hypothetical protein B7X06_01310 [Verrucomicrobia bacterium 21-51-4]|nr:MAG: hypothetical protein B7X06_01310 [Verrucomicrobia bacterium 21-51-4]HQU08390.1 DegT/DnrJ/EryC1/StrS family aminotransferase [Opitutales bacterium]